MNLINSRAYLADWANRIVSGNGARGISKLSTRSAREDIIAWLQWNDPNACYTDLLSAQENLDPLTEEEAWELLEDIMMENMK